MTYQAQAHAEWHYNAGVPAGPYGGTCPWDACGYAHDWDYEEELLREEAAREEALMGALGEGEARVWYYAPDPWTPFGPQVKWWADTFGDEPPF